jgi:hypothetical protein
VTDSSKNFARVVCTWYAVCTTRSPNEQSAGAIGEIHAPCLHVVGAVSPRSHRVDLQVFCLFRRPLVIPAAG